MVTVSRATHIAPQTTSQVDDAPVSLAGTLALAKNNRSPDSDETKDAFWAQPDVIAGSRWSQLYPYQLLVLRAIPTPSGHTYEVHPGWSYTLPIPPEGITYRIPFGVELAVTQGGIREEHNGIPLRYISLHGTTGNLPFRSVGDSAKTFGTFPTIALGTSQAVNRLVSDTKTLVNTVYNQSLHQTNVHSISEFPDDTSTADDVAKTTGYIQYRILQQFLERYAAIKKKRAGHDLRLAFAVWKEESVYLVTPRELIITRDGASPLEYRYQLELVAWKRVKIAQGGGFARIETFSRRDPNALARALNTLRDARQVIQSATRIVPAVLGDVDTFMAPLKEYILLLADTVGAVVTLADLPTTIQKKAETVWQNYQAAVKGVNYQFSNLDASGRRTRKLGERLAGYREPMTKAPQSNAIGQDPFRRSSANRGVIGTSLEDDVSVLGLPSNVRAMISEEIRRVKRLTLPELRDRRDRIERNAMLLAEALGASHDAVRETYGIPRATVRGTVSDRDWEALYALNDAIQVINGIIASEDNDSDIPAKWEIMQGLVRRSGEAFVTPRSKYAVPMPYGVTLEWLAQKYLGDANRVMEIITLNGLRSPYIDEEGWDEPLLVNGADRTVVVAGSASSRIYIGQQVYVTSRVKSRRRYRVTAIIPRDGRLYVELDDSVDGYDTVDAAFLSGFLPGTVNSQQLIYLPSDQEPMDGGYINKDIPGVQVFDAMTAAGGVDLLLDSNKDLVVTDDGDARLAIGLTNIIQHFRVQIDVPRGSYLGHPEYGLPIRVGASNNDVSPSELLKAVRAMVSTDPAFKAIESARVVQRGPAMSVDASVVVAGTSQPIPLHFDVERSMLPD